MSQEQSDGEGSWMETGTDRFVDASLETGVELRLPTEVDMVPEKICGEVPNYPGVDLDAVGPDPEKQHRFGPPNVARRKWARHGLPLPRAPEPRRQLPESGAQPVRFGDGRCTFGMSSMTHPRADQRQWETGIQPVDLVPNWVALGLPTPARRSSDEQLPGRERQLMFDRPQDGTD